MMKPSHERAGTLAAIESASGASGLFSSLDAESRAAVEAEAEWVSLESGEVLFREGEQGDALFVLITGRLHVRVSQPDGTDVLVAELGRGEPIGEMALLTGEPRSATVVAVRDSRLVRLTRAAFERVVERCPGAMLRVTQRLVHRLQQTTRAPRAKPTVATVAIVPLDATVDAAEWAQRLATALDPTRAVPIVTRARAEDAIGGPLAPERDDRLAARPPQRRS